MAHHPEEGDLVDTVQWSAYHLTMTLFVPGSDPIPVRTVIPASLAALSMSEAKRISVAS